MKNATCVTGGHSLFSLAALRRKDVRERLARRYQASPAFRRSAGRSSGESPLHLESLGEGERGAERRTPPLRNKTHFDPTCGIVRRSHLEGGDARCCLFFWRLIIELVQPSLIRAAFQDIYTSNSLFLVCIVFYFPHPLPLLSFQIEHHMQ